MNNRLQGHIEEVITASQSAVSLTPDILKILEETREGAMEELDAIEIINTEKQRKLREARNMYKLLEEENFRIDSTGWEILKLDFGEVKVNAGHDIYELLEGKHSGEQLFTQAAAKRETRKAGKQMPSIAMWGRIIKGINPEIVLTQKWQRDIMVREKLNIKLTGKMDEKGQFIEYNETPFYWTNSNNTTVGFMYNHIIPKHYENESCCISVRCLKNK